MLVQPCWRRRSRSIGDSARPIVLMEQNIKTVLGMAGRAYVIKSGRIVLEKPVAERLAAQDSWWEFY